MEFVTLNNGVKMPRLGYGVYQVSNEECERCVLDAIGVGYRAIDTAQSYGNEAAVGDAVRKCGVPRAELFLTTKIGISVCRGSMAQQRFPIISFLLFVLVDNKFYILSSAHFIGVCLSAQSTACLKRP